MEGVIGDALGHVAGNTLRGLSMNGVAIATLPDSLVAATAAGRVPVERFSSPHGMMGVVAGRACQGIAATLEARGLAEPVCGVDNLKFFVEAMTRGVVKMQNVLGKRLGRLIRKEAPLEAPERVRQSPGGRFEMALHANFKLPPGGETSRIVDRFR
jgi:hypothetical protein